MDPLVSGERPGDLSEISIMLLAVERALKADQEQRDEAVEQDLNPTHHPRLEITMNPTSHSVRPDPEDGSLRPTKADVPLAIWLSGGALVLAIIALLVALFGGVSKSEITRLDAAINTTAATADLTKLRSDTFAALNAQTKDIEALRGRVNAIRPADTSAVEGRLENVERSVATLRKSVATKAEIGHSHTAHPVSASPPQQGQGGGQDASRQYGWSQPGFDTCVVGVKVVPEIPVSCKKTLVLPQGNMNKCEWLPKAGQLATGKPQDKPAGC